jgi:hypothetical protein
MQCNAASLMSQQPAAAAAAATISHTRGIFPDLSEIAVGDLSLRAQGPGLRAQGSWLRAQDLDEAFAWSGHPLPGVSQVRMVSIGEVLFGSTPYMYGTY